MFGHAYQRFSAPHEFVPGLDRRLYVVGLEGPVGLAWLTTKYFTAGLAILMLSMDVTLARRTSKRGRRGPNAVLLNFALCYGTAASVLYNLGV